jgi:hypothetical protein
MMHGKDGTNRQLISQHDIGRKRYDRDKISVHVQRMWKSTELRRTVKRSNQNGLTPTSLVLEHNLNHPPHLSLSRIHRLPDPLLLPSEKSDEFNLCANTISIKFAFAVGGLLTAVMSSFRTTVRLSRAAKTPFGIIILRRAM